MKILLVPAAYFPALGGTERTTRMVAESLAARGHSVAVAVADVASFAGYYDLVAPRTGRPPSERMNGVDVFRLELYGRRLSAGARLLGGLGLPQRAAALAMKPLRYLSRAGFRRRLGALADRLKPDVVLSLPHLQPNVRIAAEVAGARGIPFGLFPHIHSNDPHFPHGDLAALCRTAEVCIAITDRERSLLIDDYGVSPAKALYSGLGTAVPEDDGPQPPGSPLADVLFVGRKTASKGLATLARAVEILGSRDDFRVVLIGARAADTDAIEADFRRRLGGARLVSQHDVSDDALGRWYARSRVVVLPSQIESFGSVILEAWAHRRPIVTLDLPIFREIVSEGVDGLLVPADDAAALSGALARLLSDVAEADRMGRAGFDKVLARYTWSAVADRIEGHLLARPKGSAGGRDAPPAGASRSGGRSPTRPGRASLGRR